MNEPRHSHPLHAAIDAKLAEIAGMTAGPVALVRSGAATYIRFRRTDRNRRRANRGKHRVSAFVLASHERCAVLGQPLTVSRFFQTALLHTKPSDTAVRHTAHNLVCMPILSCLSVSQSICNSPPDLFSMWHRSCTLQVSNRNREDRSDDLRGRPSSGSISPYGRGSTCTPKNSL